MRITGGKARGIPIGTGKAGHVRPATDRMREAVFSSLGPAIGDAVVLDLFAGSGSYGLEALSRGAAEALFVEKHPQAAAAIEKNLESVLKSMGRPEAIRSKVIRRDVLRFGTRKTFDLVFMDPPYDLAREAAPTLLKHVRSLMGPEGVLVLELPADLDIAVTGWDVLKRLGKSGANDPSVWILKPSDPA